MKSTSTIALRIICGGVGTVLGSFCAYAAFRNGMNQGGLSPLDQYAQGAVGAAIVVLSWVLAAVAGNFFAQGAKKAGVAFTALSFLIVPFVLANAIKFTAEHRSDKTGFKTTVVTRYDTAVEALREARAKLEEMKQNPRWKATAGCTNATVEQSKAFCGSVHIVEANITTHQNVINQGIPSRSADAGAEQLGWVLRIPTELVAKIDPVFWALIAELGCMASWFAVFNLGRGRAEPVAQPQVIELEATASFIIDEPELGLLEAPKAAEINIYPLISALSEAELALRLLDEARQAYYGELLNRWVQCGVDEEAAGAVETVAEAPLAAEAVTAVEPAEEAAPQPAKVRKSTRKPAKKGRVRDANGRFAKKAKLVAVTEKPAAKPKLGAVPLNGSENVVIFGPKKD